MLTKLEGSAGADFRIEPTCIIITLFKTKQELKNGDKITKMQKSVEVTVNIEESRLADYQKVAEDFGVLQLSISKPLKFEDLGLAATENGFQCLVAPKLFKGKIAREIQSLTSKNSTLIVQWSQKSHVQGVLKIWLNLV